MPTTLTIGISYPGQMASGVGHVAATLGGVNYESRSSAGVVSGGAARGADNRLFRQRFHLALTDAQADRARQWADAQVGKPYAWGGAGANARGYDCSGYISGIIAAALGRTPGRLFATGSWTSVYRQLGFQQGAGPAGDQLAALGGIDQSLPSLFGNPQSQLRKPTAAELYDRDDQMLTSMLETISDQVAARAGASEFLPDLRDPNQPQADREPALTGGM